MKASSLFVTPFAAAVVSIGLVCGSGGAAWSQTETLPSIRVDAPAHRAGHHELKRYAVASHTASPRTWPAASSMRSGDQPWTGCSVSAGASAYTGCRNIGPGGVPFKSYNECMENALKHGWRDNEGSFYCSSIALKE